ncbi:hypothetical protein AAU57_04550 [Nonlabens sp. YIK11]|nr:hypothetical protein AAU57_04550 [Nonlabens sp. YIK11]
MCNIEKKHRELKFKIGLSLFFVGGFFFFWILGPIITNKLKNGLKKRNSILVEKAPAIFKFYHYFFRAFAIFCLIYIVLIWSGYVQIPNE